MKKLLIILIPLAFIFIPKLCFGAIATTTVWELNADATPGNLNGGGFNPNNASVGTDYSQLTTASSTGTDLASVDGDAVPCVVTSASHNFISYDNGNIIHITETGNGFTVGWYEIVSTSGNAATLDRACGTDGAKTGGDYYVGGAISLGGTGTYGDDAFFEQANLTSKIWIKYGTYTLAESLSISADALTQYPLKIIGYNATRNDEPTGSNRPTIVAAANSFLFGGDYYEFYNIIVTLTTSGGFSLGQGAKLVNSKVVNSSVTTTRIAVTPNADIFIFNSEMVSYRGYAIGTGNSYGGVKIIGNYIHDSDTGIRDSSAAGAWYLINNIIESNVTAAISRTGANQSGTIINGNTLYGSENTTGIGINMATGNRDIVILNNIIYGFATGITHADDQNTTYINYNDFFNNDTNISGVATSTGDVILNPTFTNVAQISTSTASYRGTTLTATSTDFSNVVDNYDFVYLVSGTGATSGIYGITAHTTNTITTDIDAGESTAQNWTIQITTGDNFAIGTNLKALGFPGSFQNGSTTSYMDIGAVQRQEPAGGDCTVSGSGPAMLCF